MVFEGKKAVIVGGLGGIGYATAKILLQNGASALAILDVISNDGKVKDLQKMFTGSKIIFQLMDVSDILSVERSLHKVWCEFQKIDILVNSAGVLNEKNADLCVKVNLLGIINVCQTAIKYMGKQNGSNEGHIINIASLLGVKIKTAMPVYCATKHGVVSYTKTMAISYPIEKYAIKFINVCPSKTKTPMIDTLNKTLQRNGDFRSTNIQSAEDCADCIINIIQTAENGTTWLIKGGKSQQIIFPRAYGLECKL